MTGPLRLGVIGIGRIARAHIDAALDMPDLVRLTAFCSRDPEAAEAAATTVGVGRIYGDYHALLADDAVDAVIACVPQDLHEDVGLAAARAGKHVLMEKPLARTAGEAERLVEAARSAGITLMSAQSRRFPASVQELVRRLPHLGTLFRVHILFLVPFREPPTQWWRSADRAGGLVILLQGSHSLDSALWWLNETPSRVFAMTSRRNPAWEGEDEADILCTFPSGAAASVHLSLSTAPPYHEAVVVGEGGVLRLVEQPTGQPFGFAYTLEHDGGVVFSEPQSQLYQNQLREFAIAVAEGRPPLAAGEDLVPLMRTLDAVRQSARTGLPVAL